MSGCTLKTALLHVVSRLSFMRDGNLIPRRSQCCTPSVCHQLNHLVLPRNQLRNHSDSMASSLCSCCASRHYHRPCLQLQPIFTVAFGPRTAYSCSKWQHRCSLVMPIWHVMNQRAHSLALMIVATANSARPKSKPHHCNIIVPRHWLNSKSSSSCLLRLPECRCKLHRHRIYAACHAQDFQAT